MARTVILFLFFCFFLVNPHARSLLNRCLGFLQTNNKKQSGFVHRPGHHCTRQSSFRDVGEVSPCFRLAVHCCPARLRCSFLPHLVSRLHPNHLISAAAGTGRALACISTPSYRHQCLNKCCCLHYRNILSYAEQTGSAEGAAVSSSSTMSFQSPRT